MPPRKYTREYVIQYCKDNNIEIVLPDDSIRFKRELKVMTRCKSDGCQVQSYHTVRYIIEDQSYYCKLHTDEIQNIKFRKTNQERYGCDYPTQNDDVKERVKATNVERHGCEYFLQNKDVRERIKETHNRLYGYENPNQNPEIRERIKATNVERYGCEYPFQNKDVKEKIKATNIEKYGYEYSSQNKDVKEKIKATNVERYGCEHIFQNKDMMDKIQATFVERYGYKNPMQNSDVAERASKNAYKSYPYILPSGSTIQLQGYERYAMDILLQQYNENDIITDRSKVPELWYDDSDGVQHRYYVDIFLPKENKMIEVKSTWTYEKNEEKVQTTKKVAQNLGMIFECWIMNDKGEIIDIF